MNCKGEKIYKNVLLSFFFTSKIINAILKIEHDTYAINFSYAFTETKYIPT